MAPASTPAGPPYPSRFQMLGETPSVIPDVPINAVFLVLFLIGAVGHAWQYRVNISLYKRKFIPNAAACAFCMTRVLTTILWIVWAAHPLSIQCEIAALIFGYVGIILLFIVNLIFTRRIVRSQHPDFGWRMWFSVPITVLFLIVIATIVCMMVAIVLTFNTLNRSVVHSAFEILKFGAALYAVIAFLPIFIVGVSSLARAIPSIRKTRTMDKFGEGSMRMKVAVVLVTALLLTIGASYRAAVIYAPQVPMDKPHAAYLSKTCFYIFDFTFEFLIVAFWLVVRIDRRFYVPDSAWGPHSYASGFVFAGNPANHKRTDSSQQSSNILDYPTPSLGASTSYRTTPHALSPGPGSTGASTPLRPPLPAHARGPSRTSQLSRASNNSQTSLASRLSTVSLTPRVSVAVDGHGHRKLTRPERVVVWGGLDRDGVNDTLGENRGEIIPYAGFGAGPSSGYGFAVGDPERVSPQDLGVAASAREMGWEPKSGRWTLRPMPSPQPPDA